jgi:hypothetical protein
LIKAFDRQATQYLVFHGDLRSNYTIARSRCVSIGGELADVDSVELLEYLTGRLHQPAFVLGFRGTYYDEQCAAIYPGSAVAIPLDGCSEMMDSICEIPLLGKATIHVDSFGSVENKSKDNVIRDIHVVPHGFFRHAKNDVVTTTINIMGSIATNPVLPCCRCCG